MIHDPADRLAFDRLMLTSLRRSLDVARGQPPAERAAIRHRVLADVGRSLARVDGAHFAAVVLRAWAIVVDEAADDAERCAVMGAARCL